LEQGRNLRSDRGKPGKEGMLEKGREKLGREKGLEYVGE
jgi:hypothetical protein